MKQQEKIYHKRLAKWEAFDDIRLRVVPRYKTSGMSGDEWRTSVHVEFFHKGHVVYEAYYRDMQTAITLLGHDFLEGAFDHGAIPDKIIDLEKTACDQPGCPDTAVSKYKIKKQYSDRGDLLDAEDSSLEYYRQFCLAHNQRGDCSREDSDRNYEVLEGPGPEDNAMPPDDESPSAFGGVI